MDIDILQQAGKAIEEAPSAFKNALEDESSPLHPAVSLLQKLAALKETITKEAERTRLAWESFVNNEPFKEASRRLAKMNELIVEAEEDILLTGGQNLDKFPGKICVWVGRKSLQSEIDEINERKSKQQSKIAGKPRKKDKPSIEQLMEFRFYYEGNHATCHGWKAAACKKFEIYRTTLNNIISPKKDEE